MIFNIPVSSNTYAVDMPTECPICKIGIQPNPLCAKIYETENKHITRLGVFLKCPVCHHAYVIEYSRDSERYSNFEIMNYCEPNHFKEKTFDDLPHELSSNFKRIYNQSFEAETQGLYEIAGMGYRKALEFLIKDFLILEYPDDAESIKQMTLSNCISNKINNENIKVVASRCAWIGNDETHYYRKHEELSINDLKEFLNVTLYWISACISTKKALSIEKK